MYKLIKQIYVRKLKSCNQLIFYFFLKKYINMQVKVKLKKIILKQLKDN